VADEGRIFPIYLVEPDPSWPRLYASEAEVLRNEFGTDVIVRIHHYGSTAIPGIVAKPVIDILVEITDFEIARREMIPALEKLGYGYNWYVDHMAFFKGYYPVEQPLKYHLHAAPAGHRLMDGLLFRDYLLSHSEEARRYEELKRHLAEKHRHDREAYTDAKGDFIRETLEKARMERA
jgi:GrpB-like predicted nucleotidyltransferase (UPF0157 family)